MNSEKIYKKVMQLTAKQNLTVYQLSKKADVSHSTLYNWKLRGTVPTLQVMLKLCEALGISISRLFAESDVEIDMCDFHLSWNKLEDKERAKVRDFIDELIRARKSG